MGARHDMLKHPCGWNSNVVIIKITILPSIFLGFVAFMNMTVTFNFTQIQHSKISQRKFKKLSNMGTPKNHSTGSVGNA